MKSDSTRNRAKCANCGVTIESKHRHDFVVCSCFGDDAGTGFFLDGGTDYCRLGGNFEHVIWILDDGTEKPMADTLQPTEPLPLPPPEPVQLELPFNENLFSIND